MKFRVFLKNALGGFDRFATRNITRVYIAMTVYTVMFTGFALWSFFGAPKWADTALGLVAVNVAAVIYVLSLLLTLTVHVRVYLLEGRAQRESSGKTEQIWAITQDRYRTRKATVRIPKDE